MRFGTIGLLLAFVWHGASAQARSSGDSARCAAALSAPSADSQTTRISLLIAAFDTVNKLTPAYRSLIAMGIRQFLVVPRPLALDTYDTRTVLSKPAAVPAFAVLTMRSAYRAWLHRDGTLSQVRVVGGTRNVAFDSALVSAVRQLSGSRELPDAVAPAASFAGDSVDIRLVATPDWMSQGPPKAASVSEGVTPLVQLRLPILHVTQPASPSPSNQAPHYPETLRSGKVEGDLLFEFVITPRGLVDLSSIQVLRGAAADFVAAVSDALPGFSFKPLMVEGCAVRTLVQMPFQFHLTY